MRIVYTEPAGPGWFPITAMADLATSITGADRTTIPSSHSWSRWDLVQAMLPRRRGAEDLLLVCPTPTTLRSLLGAPRWRRGYGTVAAWVSDSWWDISIPRIARGYRQFDVIYLSEAENIDAWREATGAEIVHVPVGSNALDHGVDVSAERPTDLIRVGRMPQAWDDDVRTARLCAERGLTFSGRPAFADSATEGMRLLAEAQRQGRYVLAFSNAVAPAAYTHPTAEYLTPRWADALASGCITAGRVPHCASASGLLWDGAAIEIPHDDLEAGIDHIATGLAQWRPETAARQRYHALVRLDWRHRFARFARDLSFDRTRLDHDLAALDSERRALEAQFPSLTEASR